MGRCCEFRTNSSKNELISDPTVNPNTNSKVPISRVLSLVKGRLSDRYEIFDIIGEGAYGTVRVVREKSTNEERAAKSLLKSFVDPSRFLFSEVEILRTLDHPNILPIYEVVEDPRYYHIITGLCTGGELFDRIVSRERMNEQIAAQYFYQLISAVAYCHEHSILHRDIKPENLLLQDETEDAPLIVIDFGISRIRSKDTAQQSFKKYGMPYYCAPEALMGNYSKESDVWSCGVILYLMLSGFLPFPGKKEQAVIHKVINEELAFPHTEWELISVETKELITAMLEKDPAKRPSAKEILGGNWMKQYRDIRVADKELCVDAMIHLSQFRTTLRLTHAVLEFIAAHFSAKDEMKQLQSVFLSFDNNADGMLSREELIDGIRALELPHLNAEGILSGCDANGNGFIDYREFITACANWHNMFTLEKLKAAFSAFDADGSGFIDINELKNALSNGQDADEDVWFKIMNEVDLNGDGVIDMKEFELALIGKTDNFLDNS